MRQTAHQRSDEFLKLADQFHLGHLTTEASHPVTAQLSQTVKADLAAGLDLLFQVDADVLRKYHEVVSSGRLKDIKAAVVNSLRAGGKVFFTGCGSTGRLSLQLVSIWREFWHRQAGATPGISPSAEELEDRAFGVMAGGDFALIKAVEGFEDFTEFGKKQIGDLGVCAQDVVFAITEGGETSFVIGTAWKGIEVGAKVFFVYNNPDEALCRSVKRSREVIQEPRIAKVNLTTGPMAITGSTRMQATSIQLAVLLTVLEMAARELIGREAADSDTVPQQFERALNQMHATLKSGPVRAQLARIVALEQTVYHTARKNTYFADRFGIDVLTDTTERSPTYCTPPFRKFDDHTASDSWAFLFVPRLQTPQAWEHVLNHPPRCVEWTEEQVRAHVPPERLQRTLEILGKINYAELMRFKIGLDGLPYRPMGPGDCAIAILSESELPSLLESAGFYRAQLEAAHSHGAKVGLLYLGPEGSLQRVRQFVAGWPVRCEAVLIPVPETGLLLDGVTRVGLKMLLNALSTCTMVRLGRVMGNYMIWVVPSNLKLIDRATRYIEKLTGLDYVRANRLLFEVIDYVEPRMKADQSYPPVVGLAVTRVRHALGNHDAEQEFLLEAGS
jgi:N-acetylmuramic acid 6-phosphate etherase